MGIFDSRPNLNSNKFDQQGCDTLCLGGHNCICGTGGTISSNSGYKISGTTVLNTGAQLNTILVGCGTQGGVAATAVGSAARAMETTSIAIGCASCSCCMGSVTVGTESMALCNYSVAIGHTNIVCANNSSIIGGCGNTICNGNTNTTLIGGTGLTLAGSDYANYVVVPNLAIMTAPTGSGDILCYNSTTKKIGLTTAGSSGIATANNGLTKIGSNVVLGGTLTGDTAIELNNNAFCVIANGCMGIYQDSNNTYIGDINNYNNIFSQSESQSRFDLTNTDGTNNATFAVTSYGQGSWYQETSASTCCVLTGLYLIPSYNCRYARLISCDYMNGGVTRLDICDGSAKIYGVGNCGTNFTGIEYADDYSANYTARSLVDKGYVDSQTSGGTTYTFTNSLTESGGTVKLGGILTENTVISGGTKSLTIGCGSSFLSSFNLNNAGATSLISDSTTLCSDRGKLYLGTCEASICMLNTKICAQLEQITIQMDESYLGAMEYASDYSSKFNARTLPDVAWVTGYTSGLTASPAGSNTYVQYNNNGSFGAYCGLAWNGYRLTVKDNCLNTFISGGYDTTTGSRNTGAGITSLASISSGCDNVAIGYESMLLNVSGCRSTAVGFQSLYNTNAHYNVAVGYKAGAYETSNCRLFIDGIDRINLTGGTNCSLIYGVFNTTPANQCLRVNGKLETNGTLFQPIRTIANADTTPDVSTGNIFMYTGTSANTITDFDNSVVGAKYLIINASGGALLCFDANANFIYSCFNIAPELYSGDSIEFLKMSSTAPKYIELYRTCTNAL